MMYLLVWCLGVKKYAHYQMRFHFGCESYHEEDLLKEATFLQKLWTAWNIPLACCCFCSDFKEKVNMLQRLDQRVKSDNNLV